MNTNKQFKILLLLLVFFALSCILSDTSTEDTKIVRESQDNGEDYINVTPKKSYNVASFTIDDTHLWGRTWENVSLTYPWCSGSGSMIDPYIIENISINGAVNGLCLTIMNSEVYFIVRNCTFYNAYDGSNGHGIYLYNVTHGTIFNNTCSNNYLDGIFTWWDCYNNTISENIIKDNDRNGIWLLEDNFTKIIGNEIKNNTMSGIHLQKCVNTTISNNNISRNQNGIYSENYLSEYGFNHTISGNTINNNSVYGIHLKSNYNTRITRNIIENNTQYGIYLDGCPNNTILYNNLSKNDCGIKLEKNSGTFTCINNIVTNNIIENSTVCAIYINTNKTTIIGNKISYSLNGAGGIFLDTQCNNNNISENSINHCQSGIYLWKNNHNNITRNSIENNVDNGIYISQSLYIIVSQNNISTNQYGIRVAGSSQNITISKNTLLDSTNHGIIIIQSNNITITENSVEDNGMNGIDLQNSFNVSVLNNYIAGNSWNGIYMVMSNDIILMNNNITGSTDGICISSGCHDILIKNNNINMSTDAGIYIYSGINVVLSANNMSNCGISFSTDVAYDVIIYPNNTVNEKPVYYYVSKTNLKSVNFTMAGQIILINCSRSIISDQDLSCGTD